MTSQPSQRNYKTFKLDDRILELLKTESRKSGLSSSMYLEQMIIDSMKEKGILDANFDEIGESRGRKKKNG